MNQIPQPRRTAEEIRDAGMDEVSISRALARKISGKAMYVAEAKKWYGWTGSRYDPTRGDQYVKRQSVSITDDLLREVRDATALHGVDEKLRERLIRDARATRREARIAAAASLCSIMEGFGASLSDFDADPWSINCLNGVIDLRTGELREHNSEDLHTKQVAVHYDPNATCPNWVEFLHSVFADDRELVDYVQRCLGYASSGITNEQVLFFLHGAGANGKSTLLDTVSYVLGDYSQKAPSTLLMKRREESIPTDVARLVGTRFVVANETEQGAAWNEPQVKDLTGDETVTARFLRQDFFDFSPSHKLFVAGNHRPTVRGTDEGIWRRIKLIPFSVTFSDSQRDKGLAQRLRAERAGILTWLVQGCLAWQRQGLAEPTVVSEETAQYRRDEDRIGQFLGDQCVSGDPSYRVTRRDLYDTYAEWCRDNGLYAKSQIQFSKEISERGGFGKSKIMGTRSWTNLRLRRAEDGDSDGDSDDGVDMPF